MPKPRSIRKEIFLPHPPEDVWAALTDPQALAEWLMPNNFEPVVGRKFRFHVDPMPGPYPGGSECQCWKWMRHAGWCTHGRVQEKIKRNRLRHRLP
jgi:uncharacterized protein YndB with AHSA1/START domain